MCCYKIMRKKSLKDQLSEFIYLCFHLHSYYIKVYIYFLVKFHTFGFILKYTTLMTGIQFSLQCMIIKACVTHAHSVYGVLTGVWCLEMKQNRRNWQITSSLNTHVWLLRHFTMTYYSSDCLIDNRPCGVNLYFLCKLKAAVDEWTVQQKLFLLPNIDCKSVILYRLWNYYENDTVVVLVLVIQGIQNNTRYTQPRERHAQWCTERPQYIR
jgi:hypothetical protein